jgi:hypothetical protein
MTPCPNGQNKFLRCVRVSAKQQELLKLRKKCVPAGQGVQLSIPGTETNEPNGQKVQDDTPELDDNDFSNNDKTIVIK